MDFIVKNGNLKVDSFTIKPKKIKKKSKVGNFSQTFKFQKGHFLKNEFRKIFNFRWIFFVSNLLTIKLIYVRYVTLQKYFRKV